MMIDKKLVVLCSTLRNIIEYSLNRTFGIIRPIFEFPLISRDMVGKKTPFFQNLFSPISQLVVGMTKIAPEGFKIIPQGSVPTKFEVNTFGVSCGRGVGPCSKGGGGF